MARKYYKGFGTMSQPVANNALSFELETNGLEALDYALQRLQQDIRATMPQVLNEVLYELDTIAEHTIRMLIEDSNYDERYKQFMIPRTKVTVEHFAGKAVIIISGRTEDEIGSEGKGGNYNIWAVQEFGYSFPEIRPKNPDDAGYGRFNFIKDAGGIIARMKVIPARTISKNKNKIQELVRSHEVQIKQQIAISANSILAHWMQDRIERVVIDSGLQLIKGGPEHQGFLQQKGIQPQQLTGAGIKSIETFSTGQTVFRGSKGQFVSQSLGGGASSVKLGK